MDLNGFDFFVVCCWFFYLFVYFPFENRDVFKIYQGHDGLKTLNVDPTFGSVYRLSYVYCLSFIVYRLSFIVYRLSFIVYRLSFIVYRLSFIVYRLSFIVYRLSFIVYRLSFIVYIYRLSYV